MNIEEERYVRMFVDWLYVHGPDPNAVTRQELIRRYNEWLESQPSVVKWEAWKASKPA
jgi:hypothetical protein